MKKIVLISCASRKLKTRAKAKDIYISPLFRGSWAYAKKLNPDKIYILSALHKLLDPEQEIDPYDVTLSYVSPDARRRNPNLRVLSKVEVEIWGCDVIEQLSNIADLENDCFIVLAGQSYIEPIRSSLINIEEPFERLTQGERLKFLKSNI